MVEWLQAMGHYDMPVEQHRDGEAARMGTNHYVTGRDGGHDIDLRQFALEGMRLYGRLTGVRDGRFTFAPELTANLDRADRVDDNAKDLVDAHIERTGVDAPVEPRYTPVWTPPTEPEALDVDRITTVVWAIGFRADWTWVKVPVFDGAGYPTHARGVTAANGLYVLGLPWLHTWGSGRFAGIARDAEFLADRITELTASGAVTGLGRTLAVAAASSAARMA
jgi:putative flavoprotein involved in K+ transport